MTASQLDKCKIVMTNPYTGHFGVVEDVGGAKYIHFASTNRAECVKWLAKHIAAQATLRTSRYAKPRQFN